MSPVSKSLLSTLQGRPVLQVPIWLMRQAGRHLPEYRALRAKAGSFLELVCSPELAAEVTLQPVRRYAMDGSILFADILLVPWALGQDLNFETGEGPQLGPMPEVWSEDLARLDPIYETLRLLAADLRSTSVTQIGFVGAPWTVATYMIERAKPTFAASRAFLATDRAHPLFDRLIAATIRYAQAQIRAGAEVIKIFDSWAGQLQGLDLHRWSFEPMAQIGAALKPTPVIYFPRGGHEALKDLASLVEGPCAFALSEQADVDLVRHQLGAQVCLQGNLDPQVLLGPPQDQERAVKELIRRTRGTRHIVNLGHGVDKRTNPARVQALVDQVRAG